MLPIYLANPRGFCAGVTRAVNTLSQIVKDVREKSKVRPIFVLKEIVHNKELVSRFQQEGVTFVQEISEVPDGELLVFSAHGVSPRVRKEANQKKLITVDLTCPLVAKVHSEAIRFAKKGYVIFLIGHNGHDELQGTLGEALASGAEVKVIETVKDVHNLDKDVDRDEDKEKYKNKKLIYLTQTTLSILDSQKIINELKEKFPNLQAPNSSDICYATTNRQEAVQNLLDKLDKNKALIIVVGSQNSSNTKRLAEKSIQQGFEVVQIDNCQELDIDLPRFEQIGITSGASVPEDLVQGVVAKLEELVPDSKVIELEPTEEQSKRETTKFPSPKYKI
ncbi:MAG: 4-hydroxy-3-methylbut-2-enyl diphosphate reductase [Candidatus Ancillula sp.]|jgi:4-hydroxy-3-methylbut-2-enyl diphosphate reductase|nr:4-hydroxy-3-methylbut-2-enyl diphosphate reductase [Candidatus Ancillula sp.]